MNPRPIAWTIWILLVMGVLGTVALLANPAPFDTEKPPSLQAVSALDPDFVPGQVLARFRLETTLAEFHQTLEAVSATGYRELTPWGIYLITFSESLSVAEAARLLETIPMVLYAEPNYKLTGFQGVRDGVEAAAATGQLAPPRSLISIIDTGFDLHQPALRKHLFINPKDAPYDFYDKDPDVAGEGPYRSHGTEVALRILAEAGQNELTFLPLRVGPGPWLLASAITEAIEYSTQQQVQVIHLSFGNWWTSQTLKDSVDQAAGRKAVVVAANGGHLEPRLLENHPKILWAPPPEENPWKAWFLYKSPVRLSRVHVPHTSDWTDWTQQGKHLTDYHRVTALPGKVKGCAKFDIHKEQYLSVPDDPSLNFKGSSFSIAFWAYFDSLPDNLNQGILVKGEDMESLEYALYVENKSPNIRFLVTNNGCITRRETEGVSNFEAIDSRPLAAKRWYFVVASYDATTGHMALYLDNAEQGKVRLPKDPYDGASPLRIGALPFSGHGPSWSYLDGRFDELGIWRKVLSETEMRDLFRDGEGNSFDGNQRMFLLDSGRTLPEGLVAYYNFDEKGYRWEIGRHTVDPYQWMGFLGVCVSLVSAVQWSYSFFRFLWG